MAASPTGGVKPMAIAGRMVRERERLVGMSDEERAWRKQWLKDLELHHGPKKVEALEKELTNPIKRIYRAPLDGLYKALSPAIVSIWSENLKKLSNEFGKIFYGSYVT